MIPDLKRMSLWCRIALWCLIYLFILSYLSPMYMLTDTIPTGGDTASHYQAAVFLQESLFTRGHMVEWNPGSYAGYPRFQFYFPLPFMAMMFLALAMPLTVAFKIISMAGILALPAAAFYFLRNLEFPDPAPDLGGVFSLLFLFMEANSAWGGNIPSTLAGEFAYSIGLALSLVYLGRLFADIDRGQKILGNAALLALVGFAHGYTLLFCVIGAAFFLITTENWLRRLDYILRVNLLAFGLMGFWIVPLLWFIPNSTPFNFVWVIDDWMSVLPPILWPAAVAALFGVPIVFLHPRFRNRFKGGSRFMLYLILAAIIFYFIAFKIGLVDVRFLPFAQLFLVLVGAGAVGRLLSLLRSRAVIALSLAFFAVVFAAHFETHIATWTRWNFSGWEAKPLWSAFSQTMRHVRGDFADPRVVYEHAGRTNAAGTIRAFECLPQFAGRATLEGAYIQASPNAPFVFYIQSAVSPAPSMPLSMYTYSRFDLKRALPRLDLFNVGEYITVTEETRKAAEKSREMVLLAKAPPFTVFRIKKASRRYVTPVEYQPVPVLSSDRRADAYTWFRFSGVDVPLVFLDRPDEKIPADWDPPLETDLNPKVLKSPPRRLLPSAEPIREIVRRNEVVIQGAQPGRPLWVRITYHPNWRVEGAARIWRASPAFMLVVPEKTNVRLYYTRGPAEYAGAGLTLLVLVLMGVSARRRKNHTYVPGPPVFLERRLDRVALRLLPIATPVMLGILTVIGAGIVYLVAAVSYEDPTVYYNRGLRYFTAGDYVEAREVFLDALERFPLSREADLTIQHLALTYYNQGYLFEAIAVWSNLEKDFPESRVLPQALYHKGLALRRLEGPDAAIATFREVVYRFPSTRWAGLAAQEIKRVNEVLQITDPVP